MKRIVLRMLEPATALLFFLIVAYGGLAGFAASMSMGDMAIAFIALGMFLGLVFATVITGVIYLLISCHQKLGSVDRATRSAA